MPGGVPLAPGAGCVPIWGMVICCVVGMGSTGPEEGGVADSEAPTGISQRWPGSPCAGFGSVTVPVLAVGAWASTGAEFTAVVGAAGVVSAASSCWSLQAVRATRSESPRRCKVFMARPRRDQGAAGERYKVGNFHAWHWPRKASERPVGSGIWILVDGRDPSQQIDPAVPLHNRAHRLCW